MRICSRVLIWPDHDTPGDAYAHGVAATLHGLKCEVSIVDAAALARCAPDGGQREAVAGWDAADAADEWQDRVAIRKVAVGTAKAYTPPAIATVGGVAWRHYRVAPVSGAHHSRSERPAGLLRYAIDHQRR